jgi:hypothetical protein
MSGLWVGALVVSALEASALTKQAENNGALAPEDELNFLKKFPGHDASAAEQSVVFPHLIGA